MKTFLLTLAIAVLLLAVVDGQRGRGRGRGGGRGRGRGGSSSSESASSESSAESTQSSESGESRPSLPRACQIINATDDVIRSRGCRNGDACSDGETIEFRNETNDVFSTVTFCPGVDFNATEFILAMQERGDCNATVCEDVRGGTCMTLLLADNDGELESFSTCVSSRGVLFGCSRRRHRFGRRGRRLRGDEADPDEEGEMMTVP